jgi:MFS family permease
MRCGAQGLRATPWRRNSVRADAPLSAVLGCRDESAIQRIRIEAQVTTPKSAVSQASAPPPSLPAEGMFHSVRLYPEFRLLLLGTLATNSAFWMYQVAVGWLALEMTDSPFFVGLAGFVGGIPVLIISLPAGVLIDRFDARIVLLAAQASVMIVAALFALLVGFNLLAPWSMLLLVAAYGSGMSFVFPSRTTIVPSLVERADLAHAIALNAATQNVTRVVGPSLAGVLIALIGASGTFAVAAALQIAALATTFRLPSGLGDQAAKGKMDLSSLTVGFRIVASDRFLTALILLALAPTVLVMPYINLMPVFARDELGMGSAGLGLLLGAAGLGSVVGALSVAQSDRLRKWTNAQVATALAFAVVTLIFALMPVVSLALILLFAAGWTSAAYLALNQTVLQLHVEDAVRGRVISVYMLTWGMLPVGQLLVGTLANFSGTPLAVAAACALAIVLIAAIARRSPALVK